MNDYKSREIVTEACGLQQSGWAQVINRKNRSSSGFPEKRVHPFPNSLPGAFIFLPGQLVPPGKQQSEGSELLGVERPFLLPLHLQI